MTMETNYTTEKEWNYTYEEWCESEKMELL